MKAPHALYRTADGRLCASTDPDVAYLVCAAGAEVPDGFAAQLTATPEVVELADEPEQSDEPEVADEPEVKEVEPAPNKKAPTARNKKS